MITSSLLEGRRSEGRGCRDRALLAQSTISLDENCFDGFGRGAHPSDEQLVVAEQMGRKAVTELGFPQSPVEAALGKSINWFTEYGYTRRLESRA